MRWKWVLLGICGFVVVLIIAVYVVLSTYDFNRLKPEIARMAKERTGRELTFGGDIRLKFGFTPALAFNEVSFQNAPWGSRPELARIKRFEVQVALIPLIFKNIEVKRLILVEPDILIETDKSGRSNLEFEAQQKTTSEKPKETEPAKGEMKLPALVVNEFRITKGMITYKDGRSGKSIAVALDTLTAAAAGMENPIKLKLKGAYNSEPFEAEGTLGPLAALTSQGRPWPINVTGKAFGTNLALDGMIKDVRVLRGIDLGFALKGNDLAALGKASGKALPLKGPFDISGRLSDPAPKTYKISNLKVALGPSDLSGTVEARMAGQRPMLTAVLSSQKLDIRSMMPEGPGSGTAKTAGKTSNESVKTTAKRDKVFPDDPLPLEQLGQVDANIKIQAGQVLLTKLALNSLSVDMDLKDGRLAIKPFKTLIGGGTLEAQLDMQSQGKTGVLGVVMKVDQLDLGRILKETEGMEALQGRLDADISVRGRGSSIAGLMGGLDGKTVMVMKQGRIDNKYIDLLAGDIGSSLSKLLGLSRQDSQYTAVNCFVSGFAIKDGRADTTALVLDTDQMSVIGDGEINLKTEGLDLGLNPSPKGGTGSSKTGKISVNLSELTKAFRLTGTLAHPSMGIDTAQAAATVGKMVGGAALLGPVGLAAPLVSGSQANENLCPTAIEAAQKGVKMSSLGKPEKKGATGPTELSKEGIKELGKGLKKLFGR